jgi:hypothetical protein
MKLTEDQLCEVFAEGVKEIPEFASWVLRQTKFIPYATNARLLHQEQMSIRPRKRWWRHWWCHVPELAKDGETDIFMVFEACEPQTARFALHIENKRDNYRFSEGQSTAYAPRARHMLGKDAFLNYADFTTILIAPLSFRHRYRADCDLFDRFISYEDIGRFLPEFLA